jgi:CheY-like chemotaxis protein
MDAVSDFRKQVKDALEHLYDTAYLAAHPLLPQLAVMVNASRLTRAQKLRSTLKEAIEALRPQADLPSTAPEWRSYLALRYRYVQGMSLAQVEHELGISLRQLQRELHKGLDAVAALLLEMRTAAAGVAPEIVQPEPGEIQALRNEMTQWHLSREACEVQTLLDDAQWMLKPFINQEEVKLRIDIPTSLSPVLVDATLTRQALFHVLRLVFTGTRDIRLQASAKDDRVELLVQGHAGPIDPLAPDWQMAHLLFEQQGGALIAEPSHGPQADVVISLPQASPPRVLVVDDNLATHELFERYLAPHFYEVVHAYSGPEALRSAAEAHPNVILLDVMMPGVDGWQVLRGLAEDSATAAIPVIVCSVLKEPELAYSLGARAYLKKPVDRLELLATLAEFQAPAARAGGAPPTAP